MKSAATDPEQFEATFAERDAMAVEALADIKRGGMNAVKFFVSSDELLTGEGGTTGRITQIHAQRWLLN